MGLKAWQKPKGDSGISLSVFDVNLRIELPLAAFLVSFLGKCGTKVRSRARRVFLLRLIARLEAGCDTFQVVLQSRISARSQDGDRYYSGLSKDDWGDQPRGNDEPAPDRMGHIIVAEYMSLGAIDNGQSGGQGECGVSN